MGNCCDGREREIMRQAKYMINTRNARAFEEFFTVARDQGINIQCDYQSLLHYFFAVAVNSVWDEHMVRDFCEVFKKYADRYPLDKYSSEYRYLGLKKDGVLDFSTRPSYVSGTKKVTISYHTQHDGTYYRDEDHDTYAYYLNTVALNLAPILVVNALGTGLPPNKRVVLDFIRRYLFG